MDGLAIATPEVLRARLKTIVQGSQVRLTIDSGGGPLHDVELVAAPKPLEEDASCEVFYTDFDHEGHRLRAIVTLPKGALSPDAALPFTLFIQGHTSVS